jgi:RNA polymerase-binding transcription factor DksA
MSRAHKIRLTLLAQQTSLLSRYRDALEEADHDVESLQIEVAKQAAKHWYTNALAVLGDADMRAVGDVISALDRLDHGTYGQCTACSAAIDELLLAEQPARRCCIDCEVTAEHVIRQHPRMSERARTP